MCRCPAPDGNPGRRMLVEETGSDNPHSINATVADIFSREKSFAIACLRVIGCRNVLWLRKSPVIYVVRRQSVVMTNPMEVFSLQPGQHNRSRYCLAQRPTPSQRAVTDSRGAAHPTCAAGADPASGTLEGFNSCRTEGIKARRRQARHSGALSLPSVALHPSPELPMRTTNSHNVINTPCWG